MGAKPSGWLWPLLQWRPGKYLRASGGLLGWLLVRALAQAALVVLLARLLGPESYGLFVAMLAVAGFFSPLAGLGLGILLLRDCAKEPKSLSQHLGMTLALWWRSTLSFALLAVLVAIWWLPSAIPIPALAVFVFSEIVATSFVELAARVEQSQHHVSLFGGILAGLAIARLMGLIGYVMLMQLDPTGLIWLYSIASLIYTAAILYWLMMRYCPVFPINRNWKKAWEGLPFTIGALSLRLQTEFNKPLLAQISFGHTGNLSLAQRVVDLFSLPLQAMQEALWPRIYADNHSRRQIWVISGSAVGLGLVLGVILILFAPWLSEVLGKGFEKTVDILMWLAWMPVLQVVRNLLNAPIIFRGRQSFLIWVYIISGIACIILNGVFVPRYALIGAVMALYGGEIISLFLLTCLIIKPRHLVPRLFNNQRK